jgi:hypothetical protein
MNSIFNTLYNICGELINIVVDIAYAIYDVSLFGFVFILLPFKSVDDKLLLHNNIVTTCNRYCKDIAYDIIWKYCELVTIGSNFYKKTILPEFHRITEYKYRNEIVLVKDGYETHYFKNWNELYNYPQRDELTYDFILYTDYQHNDSKKNYTAIIDEKQIKSSYIVNTKSSVNFIIFQLTMNNVKYDISLKEPRYFILKNNILKYPFFKWYMKTVYDIHLPEKYSVYYMTQDMSIAVLHSPFFIKFNHDSVTSFSSGKPHIEMVSDEVDINEPVRSNTDSETTLNEANETNEDNEDNDITTRDNRLLDHVHEDGITDIVDNKIIESIINSEKLKTY